MDLLRQILAALLLCLGCLTATGAASAQEPPSEAQVRAQWGMLAEVAGRDFSGDCPGCSEYMMLFRWNQLGHELVWLATGAWGHGGKTVFKLGEDGTLTYSPDAGPTKGQIFRLTVEPDGSIVFPPPEKGFQIRMRFVDGRLSQESRKAGAGAWNVSLRYVDIANASAKTKEVAEKRRVKFGLSAPNRTIYASAPEVAHVANAQSEPVAAAPAPQNTLKAVTLSNAGPRLALVIGNSKYGAALGELANPANDAVTMTQALKSVGFQVETLTDADQKSIKRAIARFGERLRAAGPGSTGLFFYAGHGIQTRGTNYLIPVGAAIEAEADVDLESVAADTVLLQMEEAGTSTSIVILDACRNMPLMRSFRSGSQGLARMEAPNGSFVAYSTAPGSVAADGTGKNSPFVTALAQQISRKGQPIEVVFRDVRRTVLETTGGKQTPWDSSSLISPFYFVGE